MVFEDTAKLTTTRCSVALWNSERGFEHWDKHAEDVLSLYKGLMIERESPEFFDNIEHNLRKHEHWVRYMKFMQMWQREHDALVARLHPGLHQDANALLSEIVWITKMSTFVYPFPLARAEKCEHKYPGIANEIAWLMENVMVNACDGDIDKLQDMSVNIGTSVIHLASLIDGKFLRRDQARKVLQLMMEPIRIGLDLIDVLHTDAFEFLNEAAVDDAMTAVIDQVLAANEKAVAEYRGGKEKALGAVIGQIMKQVKADPRVVKEAVLERLKI